MDGFSFKHGAPLNTERIAHMFKNDCGRKHCGDCVLRYRNANRVCEKYGIHNDLAAAYAYGIHFGMSHEWLDAEIKKFGNLTKPALHSEPATIIRCDYCLETPETCTCA